jgi:hypothetical protein
MDDNITIILLVVIIILLIFSFMFFIKYKKAPIMKIGGCRSTRWGCCPDGKTTALDPWKSNCWWFYRK